MAIFEWVNFRETHKTCTGTLDANISRQFCFHQGIYDILRHISLNFPRKRLTNRDGISEGSCSFFSYHTIPKPRLTKLLRSTIHHPIMTCSLVYIFIFFISQYIYRFSHRFYFSFISLVFSSFPILSYFQFL